MSNNKPSYLNFKAEYCFWKPDIDYRKHPQKYKVGKGEHGVLICEPYKSEIGRYWLFKNAESSAKISNLLSITSTKIMLSVQIWQGNIFRWALRASRYFIYKG
ncbi:DUF4385 family protein [Epilithonimonas sp. JDS]|uniref:DUF4385 family protein n=1 Tax=Epilithonimonas sp. JDS TaxID=2902797 RepID=UPI001E4D78E3|nr:DUF4385 family protein [Epilithonimonas sp. JDS]MCD9856756.1 DUF4385 family protein [Epilithonimonas sp. JDS]